MEKVESPYEEQELSSEVALRVAALLDESRALTARMKEVINSLPDQTEETVAASEVPLLDERLNNIDKEIHTLRLADHQK